MSLKDDLAAPPPRSGPKCKTCDWYTNLEPSARKDFNDYVSSEQFNRAHLHRVISEKWGYPSCDSSLKYHLAFHHGIS